MKKIIGIVAAVLLACGLRAQQTMSDPNVQVREAKNFHAIHVGSAFDIYLSQGNEEKVAVSAASEKDLANITVEVKNGVLYVGWDKKGKWGRGNKKLKAWISFKMIDELNASGACDVDIAGTIKTKDLNIELSGATDLSGKIEVSNILTMRLSGASDAKLSGVAPKLNIEANGASSFKGFDFAVDYCNAEASGASDIKITVNKELTANASGASDVNYKGGGVIRDIKTSGASSVSRSS
ncbi:MAG TPA: head GIN domain-containing protein [Chitinophagaceae bacterium]|nr:head GIN domain-containing protein [Chitinophagaceae bacterium]